MIKLDIQPYCEDCQIFEADVDEPIKMHSSNGEIILTDTVIRCTKRNLCHGLKRYLEKELQKGE